ncbi:MAG: arabinogalactan oligomer/maltooligosaccharide transport system substrate-binding protein, partial [Myxococcota bacterium]
MIMRNPLVAVLIVAVASLSSCTDRKSSVGWAAQVPADTTRYVAVDPMPAPTQPAADIQEAGPTASKPTPAEPKPYVSKVTEPVTITLWHAYRAAERKALKAAVDRFHTLGSPITITLRIVPFDAFNDKIKVVVPEGRGPDLFIFAHDLVGAWSEMGFLEPLNQWTEEQDTEPFLPTTVQALVYRNALYGLPMAFKCVALYYNKALVKVPPTDMESLLAVAKANTDGKEKYGLVYEAANTYFHAPWVHGFGGEILGEGDVPAADSVASIAALSFARTLVRDHKVTPANVTTAMVSGYFNDSNAAMVINGPWMRGEIEGIDYGVVPLPPVAAGKPTKPFLGVEAVFMNKRGSQKQAAWEVMRFLVSDEAATIRFEQGQQPVANKALWNGTVEPTMAAFRQQAENTVVMSSSPRFQQVWTPYNGALLSVIAGDAKPAEALRQAQTK